MGVDHYSSIAAIGAAFRSGETTPAALTASMLDRIAALDPRLRSYPP
jgi:Asp-tRNA(Asn)/Glu-tRNA(Gln) amidotransferase A subunit family amidase